MKLLYITNPVKSFGLLVGKTKASDVDEKFINENYVEVYSDDNNTHPEEVFRLFNDRKNWNDRSMMVGDIVITNDKVYITSMIGFEEIDVPIKSITTQKGNSVDIIINMLGEMEPTTED